MIPVARPFIGKLERAEVDRVLASGLLAQGAEVAAFEAEFAAGVAGRICVAVNSGTSALHLSLLAAGVGPGDEIIVPSFTFPATANSVALTGATPVFVDIEPRHFCLDPDAVEAAITTRTRAVMPVHLYGHPAIVQRLREICERHGLLMMEDAAQAHGSEYKGRRCGSMGQLGCFSFYPGKNLGAHGEGGAVVTNDPEMARKIRLLRAWGEETRYEHKYKAFNYRMDGVQGAVLGVKLPHLETWTEARRRNAAQYARQLEDAPAALPVERAGARHVYHVYVVRLAQRDAWRAALTEAGVQTGVHYPIPVHLQPAYRDLGYHAGDFPVSERVAGEVLSLPMFPELTTEQIATIAGVLRAGVPAGSRA